MPTTTPLICSHAVMTQRGTHEVVLLNSGSYPAVANYVNQTWTWNALDWSRVGSGTIDLGGILPACGDYAMCYDGYNVVMFGGRSDTSTGGVQSNTWTWNGTAWTKEAPTTVPFGRFKAEMALLNTAGANKAIMFGGTNMLNYLSETWAWNGSAKTWTLLSPTHSPSARIDFMFSGNSSCVLFGGKSTNSSLNDTWSFNGTDWTQLTPSNPPSVRSEAAFCFDTANNQFVLFGGRDDYGLLKPETWVLDAAGTAWTQKTPAHTPSGRVGAQMCYDSQTGKVLLFGGNNSDRSLSDTWTWSGSDWQMI